MSLLGLIFLRAPPVTAIRSIVSHKGSGGRALLYRSFGSTLPLQSDPKGTTTTTAAATTATPPTATAVESSEKEESTDKDSPVPKDMLGTADLVRIVAEAHELSQAETRRILQTICDTIIDVSCRLD